MNQPLLPHGPGFRLVNEIAALEPGPLQRGRAWLNPDWPIFRDHFPGQPLLPAVYFVEMGAQMAGVLWAPAGQVLVHDIVGESQLPSAIRLLATSSG